MLNEETKEKLMPHVREIIPPEDHEKIPLLFERVYLLDYNEEYKTYVLSFWDEELPAVAFDIESYNFIGVVTQEYAQEHGVLI